MKVMLDEMTWKEIEEAMKSGITNVLVPAASIEQHGPHLPTATDSIIGREIGRKVAEKMGNFLVASEVRPGLSEHHIGFPGSLTVYIDTFVRMLEDYCESLAVSGFKKIIIFSSHGGNSDTIVTYAPRLTRKLNHKAEVYAIPTDIFFNTITPYLDKKGISSAKGGSHSGLSETSLMLYLKPEMVRMDLAVKGRSDEEAKPENLKKIRLTSFTRGIKTQSETGILGDPIGATGDIGREMFDLLIEAFSKEIRLYL